MSVLKNIVLGGATALALVLLFEGLCSTAMVVGHVIHSWAYVARTLGAVEQYTRYDSELGWVGIPNLDLRNVYGPSKNVKTNSLGYRNSQEFDRPVPAGRIRILCSGDSFTFGHGVGNDDTWCQTLESRDARLQTVNTGERGYGIDQMFLRYRRDIDRMDIDVHILAAIDNDFVRMLSESYLGYGRPVVALRGADLVVANFPIPKREWTARLESTGPLVGELRSVSLFGDLLSRVVFKRAAAQGDYDILGRLTAEQRRVILAIFESLRDLNRSRGRRFVFVRLPTEQEYNGLEISRAWRNWLTSELGKLGIPVIDLFPDFSMVPAVDFRQMFIQEELPNVPAARGHYSETGNKFVAERVYDWLTSLHELPAKPAGGI